MLHKLETFHMIWEFKKKSQYYDDDIMKEWIRFQQANFLEEYKIYINLVKCDKYNMNLKIMNVLLN